MTKNINKLIAWSFYLLLLLVPLALFHKTSELFEFNKMTVTYAFTVIITFLWIIRMVTEKKFIFKRTLLDIPLILFLISQIISTFVSIDTRTSIFGYYTRFHGGLLSHLSYSLLYWAFVSNLKRRETINTLYATFVSAILVSIYAVLEHFGIDKDIWIQDVQNRVFATLGQPNWLAAWIIPFIPVGWAMAITKRGYKIRNVRIPEWAWLSMSLLFFLVLVYTKSRSGYLGFAVLETVFWSSIIFLTYKKREALKRILKNFLIIHLIIALIISITGTPWSPSASKLFKKTPVQSQDENTPERPPSPALEVERYDSGRIRQIVWQGAIDIWKSYPIVGSGVETFAYSYYQFRPVEHNLVSEWDFLYNKAHNEYLNFLATTGAIGTGTYVLLIISICYVLLKLSGIIPRILKSVKGTKKGKDATSVNFLSAALLSGFSSILVTNFFGFSVVPVALNFFLFPAFIIGYSQKEKIEAQKGNIDQGQKAIIVVLLLVALWGLYQIGKYWQADYLFAQGKGHADVGNYLKSRDFLNSAVKLSPNEAIFWDELAQTNARIAVLLNEEGNTEVSTQLATEAAKQSERAVNLSPANVNLKRTQASIFINMSAINPNYLILAKTALEKAVESAPTEAKLIYNLGLTHARLGDTEKAKEIFLKTIEMKPNYRNPYYALGIIYADEGKIELAKEQLEYILENISPGDKEIQRQLDEFNN